MRSKVPTHRRYAFLAAAAASLALVTAAGCDSSTSDSAAAGTPVKVMVSGILSTPAANFVESVNGADAAASAINKAGGINGHPIQIVSCNDNLTPADAVSCAREAVQQGVIAYAGGNEPLDSSVFPYLDSVGIPWVGPQQNTPAAGDNAYSFPLEGEVDITDTESGKLAVEKGGKRVVVIQLSDAPASVFGATFLASAVTSAGGTVAKLIGAPIETVNWSSYAAQAMNAAPDAISCACSPQGTPQLLHALRQAGFTGPLVEPSTDILNSGLKSLGSTAGKVYLVSTMRDPDVPNAGLTQYLDEMNATQPASALRDQTSELSWLAVHVVADLLKGQQSLTSATLLRQLRSTKGVDGYGLIANGVNWLQAGPLTKYPRYPDSHVLLYQWENGKLVALGNQFSQAIG